MKREPLRRFRTISYATLFLFFHAELHAQSIDDQSAQENVATLRQELNNRIKELDALKRKLAEEEANFQQLSRALDAKLLETKRGAGEPSTQPAPQAIAPSPQQPVGQAPVPDTAPPAVAPIFDQPGVLTPRNKLTLEPSFQFGYSSSDRVALVGYTIIPALLIGLIDVREINSTVLTAGFAARYVITNRMEIEVRVPYVYSTNDTVSREVFTGSAQDNVFNSS